MNAAAVDNSAQDKPGKLLHVVFLARFRSLSNHGSLAFSATCNLQCVSACYRGGSVTSTLVKDHVAPADSAYNPILLFRGGFTLSVANG